MLRVQLSNPQIGAIILDPGAEEGLDDPQGLEDLEQTIKRSKDNDGVVYEITISLDWAKRARSFIHTCYRLAGGLKSEVTVNVFEYWPNERQWKPYYTGLLDFSTYKINDIQCTLPIKQVGFQQKVINRMDADVDVQTTVSQSGRAIPETPFLELEYHPKKIVKESNAKPTDSNVFGMVDVTKFTISGGGGNTFRYAAVCGQVDSTNNPSSEYEETFSTPFGFSSMGIGASAYDNVFTDYSVGDVVVYLDKTYVCYVAPPDGGYNPVAYPQYWAEGIANVLKLYPDAFRAPQARATEKGQTTIRAGLDYIHSVYVRNDGGDVDICGEGALGRTRVTAIYEHRREDNTIVEIEAFGEWAGLTGCGGNSRVSNRELKEVEKNILVEVGDKIYVYYVWEVWGSYERPSIRTGYVMHEYRVKPEVSTSYLTIKSETEFEATTHKTILIYEVLNKLVQYYTDQIDCFKSDFFGRTDTSEPYPVDGEGSLIGLTNGRILRLLENDTLFANLQDTFDALNSVYCLGMGFEVINGVQKFVIEPKEYFYRKYEVVLELGCVEGLEMEIATDYYYSKVEVGFPKIDAGQINGIDEFATVRKYVSPFSETKATLSIKSELKASGYEIESQRRLQNSTKDSRNDDSIYMVSLIRKIAGGFATKKREGYTIVNNLYDAESAYNLDFAPARNLKRWFKILAAPLWLIMDKIYTFSYGEGNYIMETQKAGETTLTSESKNMDLTGTIPLIFPERFKFKHPLTRDQFRLLMSKPYGVIRFKDLDGNTMDGYMEEVKHKNSEKLGDFKLLRARE